MIYTNSGLKLFMESALGSAITVTAVTNAAPGVFTAAAHGVTGSFSLLDIAGGSAYVSTLGMDTFVSCSVQKVTFGTTIAGVKDFSPKGGDIKFVDTTTVQDKKDQQVVVGATAMSYDLTMLWDPADAGQTAMINAFNSGVNKCFKIQWPNGRYALFAGSVGYGGAPGGGSQNVVTSPASVALTGNPSYAI
jgi:Phage tail tube protein, TTP